MYQSQALIQLEYDVVDVQDENNHSYHDSLENFYKDYNGDFKFTHDFTMYNRSLHVYVLGKSVFEAEMQEYKRVPELDAVIDNAKALVEAQRQRTMPPTPPVDSAEAQVPTNDTQSTEGDKNEAV